MICYQREGDRGKWPGQGQMDRSEWKKKLVRWQPQWSFSEQSLVLEYTYRRPVIIYRSYNIILYNLITLNIWFSIWNPFLPELPTSTRRKSHWIWLLLSRLTTFDHGWVYKISFFDPKSERLFSAEYVFSFICIIKHTSCSRLQVDD